MIKHVTKVAFFDRRNISKLRPFSLS
uniref:Uncharacterized protein n=1 Tax=Anguilla anguilla TaxID=7936 RepID=A0A0E9UEB5_ANGAN